MSWELLGLDSIKESFSKLIGSGRFPHALLLTGLEGSGRFSLSLALAKAINCEKPESDHSPCLTCLNCRLIAELKHPDLIVIEPNSLTGRVIPIDEIKQLRKTLRLKPYHGRYKIAVIRQAERLSEESGGALLKTLEEPSPFTVLILNSRGEADMLPTLVSRCLRFKTSPIDRQTLLEALKERNLGPMQSRLLAGLSGGALGLALNLDAGQAWRVWEGIDRLFLMRGHDSFLKSALDWTTHLTNEVERLKKLDDGVEQKNALIDLTLNCLRLWWRDSAILAATNDHKRLCGPPPSKSQREMAKIISANKLTKNEEALATISMALDRSIRMDLVFENYWRAVLE
ncbi:MAG: DNA polymerase III subunit [Deltaproteobacteria bacterium]|jgi:DNA polymerase III delta' subunit|nr:DNA polymerase III subunit [Deltaproteobacteria bacterium]